MSLNPLVYTDKVLKDFLRYQLSTYALADADLHNQLRNLLNLDESISTYGLVQIPCFGQTDKIFTVSL